MNDLHTLTTPVLPLRATEDYFSIPASDALADAFESLEHLWDVEIAVWMSVIVTGPSPYVAHLQSLFLQPTGADPIADPCVVQKWDNGFNRVEVDTVKERLALADIARLEAALGEVTDDWFGGVYIKGDVGFRVREVAIYSDTPFRFFWQPGKKSAEWFEATGISKISNLLHLLHLPQGQAG